MLSLPELVTLGIVLASIDHGDNVNPEVSYFINAAAKDCVIRAKTIVAEALQNKTNPTFLFQGKYVAVDMAYYLKNDNQCYRYHELFFNGLLSVLYGSCGHKNKDLKKYMCTALSSFTMSI